MITIPQITDAINKKKLSARAAVEQALKKLRDSAEYNLVISECGDMALAQADAIDAKIAAGEQVGRLAGVPFIAKDNFLTFGGDTTAASNILKGFKAPYQSTAIEKLQAEGAILIAKANLDSFGHGGSTENSDFGVTKNPHDKTRVAGGSSGGSAAAVALDIVPFALGTDTGGSSRQPASFCGVYGIKPTYGMVSRYGVVAMASSTDTVGLLCNTAEDASLIYDIIAGKDPLDSTSLPDRPKSFLVKDNPVKSLKVGIIKEAMTDVVQPEVLKVVREQAKQLQKLGHEVTEVSVPSSILALAVYYIVVPAEVSSNLSRYDGVRYGYSDKDAKTLDELYGLSRDHGFNAENKRRILIGTYVLSSGYIDAYYRKAQTVRTKLINEFAELFADYDVLICPVAPTTAFKIGENTADPLQMYLTDVMTVSPSLAGLPAISVPAGFDDNNLPIGLQLIGAQKSDPLLLSLAAQLKGAK
ncbi:MAG TPA: Asp-tRNA(Asn)/Glu-tRNA(Gln) amidotransferase subunit GatA [Candidatus Saccharimonadales bacterium]|nr:Asp-tRNA(Asn)/Glu-tRNA(Gln) amidotransferase subunit GatA [Candidatus Saccharimonadales bacterium]